MLLRTTEVIDTFVYRSMRTLGDVSFATAVGMYQAFAGFILVGVTNWTIIVTNANLTAAHIHESDIGRNGGVIVSLATPTPAAAGFTRS